MTSERQRAANKFNARKSSGPRTHAGKARSSKNAYRHGFARTNIGDTLRREVDRLARKIAGHSDSAVIRSLAQVVAEEDLTIARVRRAKTELIENFKSLSAFGPAAARADATGSMDLLVAEVPARSAEALSSAVSQLARLDRYEQRARSHRDRTIRRILEIKQR